MLASHWALILSATAEKTLQAQKKAAACSKSVTDREGVTANVRADENFKLESVLYTKKTPDDVVRQCRYMVVV